LWRVKEVVGEKVLGYAKRMVLATRRGSEVINKVPDKLPKKAVTEAMLPTSGKMGHKKVAMRVIVAQFEQAPEENQEMAQGELRKNAVTEVRLVVVRKIVQRESLAKNTPMECEQILRVALVETKWF
jgi:hypothetical protein